jgi:hypothetical protein
MIKSNISIHTIDYNSVEEKEQHDLVNCTRKIQNGIIARNKIYVNRCQKILTKLNNLLCLYFTSSDEK